MPFPEGDLAPPLPLTQRRVQDAWATTTSCSHPQSDGVSWYLSYRAKSFQPTQKLIWMQYALSETPDALTHQGWEGGPQYLDCWWTSSSKLSIRKPHSLFPTLGKSACKNMQVHVKGAIFLNTASVTVCRRKEQRMAFCSSGQQQESIAEMIHTVGACRFSFGLGF